MRTERPAHDTAAPRDHVHGEHCAVCGHAPGESRKYTIADTFLAMLFEGVCASLELTVTPASNRRRTTFLVHAPDAAAHDRLRARFKELQRDYEYALIDAAAAYLRQHCGVELRAPAR